MLFFPPSIAVVLKGTGTKVLCVVFVYIFPLYIERKVIGRTLKKREREIFRTRCLLEAPALFIILFGFFLKRLNPVGGERFSLLLPPFDHFFIFNPVLFQKKEKMGEERKRRGGVTIRPV